MNPRVRETGRKRVRCGERWDVQTGEVADRCLSAHQSQAGVTEVITHPILITVAPLSYGQGVTWSSWQYTGDTAAGEHAWQPLLVVSTLHDVCYVLDGLKTSWRRCDHQLLELFETMKLVLCCFCGKMVFNLIYWYIGLRWDQYINIRDNIFQNFKNMRSIFL